MCTGIYKYFPYSSFRIGQEAFLMEICKSLRRGSITLIEAPNGMGKTSAILTAISYLSQREGMRFLYLVRTHRQIDRVLEECSKFKKLKLIAFRGKKELCLNWKVKWIDDYRAFSIKCNELKEKDLCPFYKNALNAPIASNKCEDPIRRRDTSCPYYFTLKLLKENGYHAIVLSYTYLLDPEIGKHIREILRGKKVSLIIDEAHNLKRHWINSSLKKVDLVKLRDILVEASCDGALETILSFLRSGLPFIEIPREYLKKVLKECNINKNTSWIVKTSLNQLINDILSSSRAILTRDGMLIVNHLNDTVEDFLREYGTSILISGTWGGERSKLEFLEDVRYSEISISNWGDATALVVRDFTTKFKERSRSEYYRLATVLADLSNRIIGNMGIFTASYDVLSGLLDAGFEHLIKKDLFIERRDMKNRENTLMIRKYKGKCKEGAILLGVQGGRNSEGEDFPGLQMTTSVVVGLQIMKPGVEKEILHLLWKKYSRLENPDLMHGCRIAIQAAARPIRSPTDLGFIILADKRFKACLKIAPSWLSRRSKIVSLKDIPALADDFFSSKLGLSKE